MLHRKDVLLLRALDEFYAEPANLRVLTECLTTSTVSLRVLDWLVSNCEWAGIVPPNAC